MREGLGHFVLGGTRGSEFSWRRVIKLERRGSLPAGGKHHHHRVRPFGVNSLGAVRSAAHDFETKSAHPRPFRPYRGGILGSLFDDLLGAFQQRERKFDPERFCRFEVDG